VTWWLLSRPGGERVVAHLGSSDGLESSLVLVPERGFAVAVLTNAQAGMALGLEVTIWALERFIGLIAPRLAPVPTPPARLAEYDGDYDFGGGAVIRIEEREDALHLAQHVPGQAAPGIESPIRFVGADRVASESMGLTLLSDFVRDDAGKVAWIRFAGRLAPRVG
jgi:hypothetical protein